MKLWKTNMGSLTIISHKSYLLALPLDFKLLLYIPLSVKKEEGSSASDRGARALCAGLRGQWCATLLVFDA